MQRTYTHLNFGKHASKTLPQVLLQDPNWFFWAAASGILHDRHYLASEATELIGKSQAIRLHPSYRERFEVLYSFDDNCWLRSIDLWEREETESNLRPFFITGDLDLWMTVRLTARIPRLTRRLLQDAFKCLVLRDRSAYLSKSLVEGFFADDRNFSPELPSDVPDCARVLYGNATMASKSRAALPKPKVEEPAGPAPVGLWENGKR